MGVYISGVGMAKFGRSKNTLEKMMVEAASSALQEARRDRVDAIYIGVMNAEEFSQGANITTLLSESLGLTGIPSTRLETNFSTGAGAFETAFYAVASGNMDHVLVLGGERTTHLPAPQAARLLSEGIDRAERRCGVTLPALAAMAAHKYAQESNLSPAHLEDILSKVAIKNLANGVHNPCTQFKREITKGDYLKSQMVSYPLHLYDCAPITDGASAILLTSEPSTVRVSGIGHATDTPSISCRASLCSFNATKEAALKAYAMAHCNPSDIQFGEVFDPFTILEIIGTEDLGLLPPGMGWRALEEGKTSLGGNLPINPSGGLMSRGHPAGASGLAQLAEIVYQLRGDAGEGRQLKKAEIGLAQSHDGWGNTNLVTVLEQRDRGRLLKEGWRPDYHPEINVSQKGPPSPLGEEVGLLETFTTLYASPEGFRSPLTLGFVTSRAGERVLACNPDYASPKKLKMGEKISLKQREGLYVLEKLTLWERLKDWIKEYVKPL